MEKFIIVVVTTNGYMNRYQIEGPRAEVERIPALIESDPNVLKVHLYDKK